jgi:hypothetical protein
MNNSKDIATAPQRGAKLTPFGCFAPCANLTVFAFLATTEKKKWTDFSFP